MVVLLEHASVGTLMSTDVLDLVWPAAEYLPGYVHALRQGWSPDTRRSQTALDHLARIDHDSTRFLSEQVDREAKGPPIILPDASRVPRLPGYSLWMWDGDFCGSIGLRWQPGTMELPSYCPGHAGYSVVPWKRRRGYATLALRLLLPHARAEGLVHIDLSTDADNVASRRVIEANGGMLIARVRKPPAEGGTESLRFRILLASVPV